MNNNEWIADLEKQLKLVRPKTEVKPSPVVELPAPKQSKNNILIPVCIFLLFFLITLGAFSLSNFRITKPLITQDEKLQKKVNWCEDRIFILGVVTVHNQEVVKRNLSPENMITIDSDWKLSKYPNLVKFDEKSRPIVDKFMK